MGNGYYSTKKARAVGTTIPFISVRRTARPRFASAQAARSRSRRTGNGSLLRTSKRGNSCFTPPVQGEQKQLTHDNIVHDSGRWTPDGKWIVFSGFEPGKKARTWIMPAEGGTPKPITP